MSEAPDPEDKAMSRLWWAVPAAAVLVLMVLAMLLGKPEHEKKQRTSYDASDRGTRAAYLLLEGLGYPVTRSKKLGGDGVKFVLFPFAGQKNVNLLDAWVHNGGILVFGDGSTEFAKELSINLEVKKKEEPDAVRAVSGEGEWKIAPGRTRISARGSHGRPWAMAGDEPIVTVYPRGRGEIWLLNHPEIFENEYLKQADNAILLSRLADETLGRRGGKLGFDEYFHGMRDRPGVAELLLEPPALWVTLQGCLLIGLLIWHYAPRFGTIRPLSPGRRRSKEEFLNAMASLLERKNDREDAYDTVRYSLFHTVEAALGLPPGSDSARLLANAERRKGRPLKYLRRAVETKDLAEARNDKAFIKAMRTLEIASNEFFEPRNDRQPS